jgi:ABC-type molybdate transport system ATPase subunit
VEVARIVGVETLVAAEVVAVVEGLATVAIGDVRLCVLAEEETTRKVYVSIRAEDVVVRKDGAATRRTQNHLAGVVRMLVQEGPLVRLHIDCGFTLAALIPRRVCEELRPREGEPVQAVIEATAVHLIPKAEC